MMLLIKLLLAHMIGDFILQPNSWVEAKEKRRLKAWQLYAHVLVHGVLVMLVVWNWSFLPWALLIALSHLVIDGTKLTLQKYDTKRQWFFVDQLTHVITIYLIFCWRQGYTQFDVSLINETNVVLATAVIFLITPSAYVVKNFISKWEPEIPREASGKSLESLKDAGMYIGIFERLFVFIFVVTSNWEAIGFLLAAKSVFRFGDLKEPKERNLTEYILIGTLASFGIAMLAGMICKAYLP